jgi:hypothetical protein
MQDMGVSVLFHLGSTMSCLSLAPHTVLSTDGR